MALSTHTTTTGDFGVHSFSLSISQLPSRLPSSFDTFCPALFHVRFATKSVGKVLIQIRETFQAATSSYQSFNRDRAVDTNHS
jgi:hypothetical protein